MNRMFGFNFMHGLSSDSFHSGRTGNFRLG